MRRRALITAAMCGAMAVPAWAQHVTAPTVLMTNVIDLTGVDCADIPTTGPITLNDGIIFTSSSENAYPCYSGQIADYGLLDNGRWTVASGPFAGLNDLGADQWMRFTFLTPVSEVGAFLNFLTYGSPSPYGTPFFEALDASNNVIDSYDVSDISTPDGLDDGAFRGIVHDQADIYSIQLRDSYIVARDIEYGAAAVVIPPVTGAPEPASLALAATGLIGLALLRRQKRSS